MHYILCILYTFLTIYIYLLRGAAKSPAAETREPAGGPPAYSRCGGALGLGFCILMGYSGLMGFYSGLMGFYSGLMGFYSGLMGFYSGLMGFYSGLMGFIVV